MIFSSDCCRGLLSVLPQHAKPFVAALPFALVYFGSAANTKLVALPKKPCFLAGAVKNGDSAVVAGRHLAAIPKA
ncbi:MULTISPECIES: hypothetical protein [unclassified Rhizobium]|uniref:hypothetical protein n=1 Tax=unclassified Rhizobium TaxID=2613769 RepID=UPI001A99E076|nr:MULTISPECIES: hypothetical protein [unclassified Rhizobium]MBX5156928.1 hypothetical protein [Rhizobium sp. NZLR8]MBX5168667.1 hypothetical protein [Rhizobium sp. NZLR1b]MBX5199824.1 hypothetical protein [Rhizobium sp. NZLR1]QSZ23537.1 hypothetical protein J3O30_25890 [Rhizobium sp. NZLR1]